MPFINVLKLNDCKRPGEGKQLEPKHVAMNKLIKSVVVCDRFDTFTCDLSTPTGMSRIKITRNVYCQLTEQLVLMLHVSTANRSHLQGAASVEYMHSVLHTLSNINGKIFIHISYCIMLLRINRLKPGGFFTYRQVLTFKNSTWRSLCVECFVRISEQTASFALYSIN